MSSSPTTPSDPALEAALAEIRTLDDALWAGAVLEATAALETTLTEAPAPVAAMAREMLAAWCVASHRIERAVELAAELVSDTPARAVVTAQVALAADEAHRARSILAAAVERWPTDVHLRLHHAALRTGTERVAALDRLLVDGAHPPFDVRPGEEGEIRFDGLVAGVARTGGRHPEGQPLVSVIVPAFDAAEWIAASVASLQAQTHTNLQILVVDDASRDATPDIVRALARSDARISLVRRRSNGGAYAARNDGLAQAVGAFVCVHDADDWAHPDRIATQIGHLGTHEDVTANLTALVRVDRALRAQPHGRHPYKVVGKNTASLLVRREAIRAVGPWDAGVRSGADFEFLKRLESRFGSGSIVTVEPRVPLTLALRRSGSLTTDTATGMSSLWHLHGARRQYLEAFTAWHAGETFTSDLPLDPRAPRKFAAPAALRGVEPGDYVDVVVRADLSAGSPAVDLVLDEIVAAVAAGRSSALWHDPGDLPALSRPLDVRVMGILAEAHSRFVARGDALSARELVTVGAPGLELEGAPSVRSERRRHLVIRSDGSPPS